jgi:hypothetical protein
MEGTSKWRGSERADRQSERAGRERDGEVVCGKKISRERHGGEIGGEGEGWRSPGNETGGVGGDEGREFGI